MDTDSNSILIHLIEAYKNTETTHSFHTTIQLLPQIVFTFDLQNQLLHFHNKNRLMQLLGYDQEDIARWDNSVLSAIYHEDLVMGIQEINHVYGLKEGNFHFFNCRFNHKTEKYRYVKLCGAVLSTDAAGNNTSFIFAAEDNTEKVELENRIRSLQFQVNDTENLLDYGSWSWEIGTGILHWSDGMYKILGYAPGAIQSGLSIQFYLKHISAQDLPDFHDRISTAIKNKTDFECRYTIHTYGNQHKIVLTKGRVNKDLNGKANVLSGITCDITNLTKINSDLLSYKEMIMEREYFLHQGSWETNVQTGETTWSRGMYHIFGYDTEQQIQDLQVTNVLHFKHLSEAEVERSMQDWARVLKDQDDYVRESPIITFDGRHKQVETYGKIFRNKDGTPEKVIGTTRDITALKDYKNTLEAKVNELNHINAELEGFAYIASHDLQEPLRKLTAFSERLQTKFRYQLGEEGLMYLDKIGASTANMRTLIDNLLEFSRTARSDKHFSKQDMMKLLKEAQSDLELKIEESGTVIHTSALPVIEVIPSQIKQLFSNLLGNSIKFKKAGQPLVIRILCEHVSLAEKIHHNLYSGKEYYKLLVTDNGIGFEAQYAEKIFQMFQRLHGKHEYPGSGIGLAICKKIVENHNGIMFADAESDSGAVFTIILPVNQM